MYEDNSGSEILGMFVANVLYIKNIVLFLTGGGGGVERTYGLLR